jgi:hypothetical protein
MTDERLPLAELLPKLGTVTSCGVWTTACSGGARGNLVVDCKAIIASYHSVRTE